MSGLKRPGGWDVLASENDFVYYALPSLLWPGHVFVLNKRLGVLSHLAFTELNVGTRLVHQEQFSTSELRVLLPLLELYPNYCPYETAWASFYTGQMTDEATGRARLRLQEARFAGVWDHEMKPLRNTLSRVRLKLRHFQIEVRSIIEVGYLLKPLEREAPAGSLP